MQTATAIAHLRRHQDALSALLDRATALLSVDAETARLPLAGVRWSIARKAREYQLFKHTEIFDPAIAGGAPVQATLAEDMKRACLAISADFEAYVRRWVARDAVAQWAEHRTETAAITTRLRRHLVVERQQVERLLAGAERTRCLSYGHPT